MSHMKTIAIEAANGEIPTVRQALRDLVDACYMETSIGGRWKESGPDRCRLCGAVKADPLQPHAQTCEVGLAEKALIADVVND